MGQLSGYTTALIEAKYPIKGSGFLAVDKQLGKICTCLFNHRGNGAYRNEPIEALYCSNQEKSGTDCPSRKMLLPAVPLSKKTPDGPMVLGNGMLWCIGKHHTECWKDANGGQGVNSCRL